MKIDVVIVGAGVSGVPAAVASARAGAKTLLIEPGVRSGGTMISSLGFPLCGLFENDMSKPPRLLNEGLSEDFFTAVSAEISDPVFAMGRVRVCRCPVALFESIYSKWLDEKNLTVCFGATVLSLGLETNCIKEIRFRTAEGGLQTIEVGQVVDCTGCGEVLKQSGADQIVPETLPLAGFSVRLEGVKEDDLLPVKVPYVLRKAIEANSLPDYFAFTGFTPLGAGRALCKFSLPVGVELVDAEPAVRRAVQWLQKNIPALSKANAVEFSPSVLLREGARLKGDWVLSAEDIRSGRCFDDSVARGNWPMEYWDVQDGVQYEYIQNGVSYDIPKRSLRSVNIRNCWAAGRLLSADSRALASARVMGTAIATGEAAGKAAAEGVQ